MLRLRKTYEPDAQRYFDQAAANGAAAGTALWKASVNNLVVWMKAKSLWPTPSTGFDAVYLWAVPDTVTGRVNLVFPTQKNLTISGAPTFAAYKSIKGNGVDCMLSSATAASFTRYVQNSAHVSAWALSSLSFSWGLEASTRLRLNNVGSLRLNANGSVDDTGIGLGLYAADRPDASVVNSFYNGVAKSVAVASASVPKQSAVALFNANGVFTSTEIAFAAIGSNLSAQQEADLYTGVRTFLLANSVAGVT